MHDNAPPAGEGSAPMRTALADLAPQFGARSAPPHVTLTELPVTGQIDLRGHPADPAFVAGVQTATGLALPLQPNRTLSANGSTALWLGPDEWLLVVAFDGLKALITRLEQALHRQHVAITDVSASRTILALRGPSAREALMKGCSLDLHPGYFKPGHCAQTNLARAQLILQQIDADPTYHLYVRPSFAAYVATWLLDAIAEYRLDRRPSSQ